MNKRVKKSISLVTVFLYLVTFCLGTAWASPKDTEGHWATKEINDFVSQGLASGYDDGTFRPNATVTRAEFVAMTNRVFGFTTAGDIDFKDVPAKAWFFNDIAIAKGAGYINGYSDGTFKPNEPIKRVEAAIILAQVLKLPQTSQSMAFADKNQIPAWSLAAVQAMVGAQVMNGYPDGTYKPGAYITRAETTVILSRGKQKQQQPATPEQEQPTTPTNTGSGGGGGGSSSSRPASASVATGAELFAAVNRGTVTVTLTNNIDLDEVVLDLNRDITINGGDYTITGNVAANVANIRLNNVTISGDLILGEGIGEGEAYLTDVTVLGDTVVEGGGSNSIHFTDSVLMTVIVNKNTGAVRIVAEGTTTVAEVQLESVARIEEALNLTGAGFGDVVISESFQGVGDVELLGTFDTVNSRAANVRIMLAESTDVATLVLSAVAEVIGSGAINLAEINADGVSLEQVPANVVLNISGSANIGGQDVTESYCDAESATLNGISATQASISLAFDQFIVGLDESDFTVTASVYDPNTVTEAVYHLDNLVFDSDFNRFTFDPVSLTDNLGKQLLLSVEPSAVTASVYGEAQTVAVALGTGFGGRITDIYGVGVPGLIINFRAGFDVTEGEIVESVVTDARGYYSVYLPAGNYTGELVKAGYVQSYLLATALSDRYNIDQNETAIRAAGIDEIKIVLTWGYSPSDEDSHLVGPPANGMGSFHTWYDEKQYAVDGVIYADLDWDDTESYGPETTTIRKLVDGKYSFYVHNFSGEAPLGSSGATVKVYVGNSTEPQYIYTVPEVTSTWSEELDEYWLVFDMDVSNNGANVTVTPIDEMVTNKDIRILKMDLGEILCEAGALLEDIDVGAGPGQYSQATANRFEAVLNEAQQVYNDSQATTDELAGVLQRLELAIEILSLGRNVGFSIEENQTAINAITILDESIYVNDGATVGEVMDAFVFSDETYTISMVNFLGEDIADLAMPVTEEMILIIERVVPTDETVDEETDTLFDDATFYIQVGQAKTLEELLAEAKSFVNDGAIVGEEPGKFFQTAVDFLGELISYAEAINADPEATVWDLWMTRDLTEYGLYGFKESINPWISVVEYGVVYDLSNYYKELEVEYGLTVGELLNSLQVSEPGFTLLVVDQFGNPVSSEAMIDDGMQLIVDTGVDSIAFTIVY